MALGSEPVRVGGEVVGRVTSGGFGYTVDASIAYAYLPVDVATPGTEVRGERVRRVGRRVRSCAQPLVDPKSTRVHADG